MTANKMFPRIWLDQIARFIREHSGATLTTVIRAAPLPQPDRMKRRAILSAIRTGEIPQVKAEVRYGITKLYDVSLPNGFKALIFF